MRSAGLPVAVLAEYVGFVQQGDETVEARRAILVEQREQLIDKIEELEKVLGILDHKIEVYGQIMLKIEQNLAEAELEVGP
jgi:DNA-binding transcriptional MerR regulator